MLHCVYACFTDIKNLQVHRHDDMDNDMADDLRNLPPNRASEVLPRIAAANRQRRRQDDAALSNQPPPEDPRMLVAAQLGLCGHSMPSGPRDESP